MKQLFGFLFIFCHLIFDVQEAQAQKSQLKKAETYFESGKYAQALSSFKQYKKTDKVPDLLVKRGICYLNTNQPDLCIEDMYKADILKSINNKRFYYTAKAYFLKGAYEDASKFYKRYLNTLKRSQPEYKQIVSEIQRCGFARNIKYLSQVGFTENMGRVLNTEYNEIKPKQSPNKPERYYYSSDKNDAVGGLRNEKGETDILKGKFAYDIYYSEFSQGNWTVVMPINQTINTSKNEEIQGFNEAGLIMYYLKKEFDGQTTLLADTFGTDKSILPKAINRLPFRAELGDQGLMVVSDSLIIFSSKRIKKEGDYDLVFSMLTDTTWTEPLNFGPEINTMCNESAPYFVKDGKTLYFSSDRLEGLGGFDIFFTNFKDGKWSKPQNLGPTINSPADDLDVEIAADGATAVFSSNRVQSVGGFDLYITYLKEPVLGQTTNLESMSFVEYYKRYHLNHSSDETYIESLALVEEKSEYNVREVIIKPVYFTNDEDLLGPANLNNIKTFADILTVYPDVNIVLQSYSTPETMPESDLYFSVKRAEKIAEQLVMKGVNPNNIIIQGYGSNFPKAANKINDIPSTLAKKTNNRIDILWQVKPETPLSVKYENAPVNEEFRDTKWDLLETKNQKLTFRIQIASTTQMIKSEWMQEFEDFIIDKNYNENKYTYTLGNFLMYQEASDLMKQLESQYLLTNLKIHAYHKGMKVDEAEINALSQIYPELINYLNANE
jgi:outer membrane protein OmpA-like peptidoglycan-associated protein/chaperonin cofactor prefoldin